LAIDQAYQGCVIMDLEFDSYETIKKWKDGNIGNILTDHLSLNIFHDQVMKKVLDLALIRVNNRKTPCAFCWFITGSGGRMEQGIISDQDHGIIFEIDSAKNEQYFLNLGKEISNGMDIVGYPFCNGNIMSSNPRWCKSLVQWKKQLSSWMEESDWESIRNLQIFFDARSLLGTEDLVLELKNDILDYQKKHGKCYAYNKGD
jgi:CBS domain-containing protein